MKTERPCAQCGTVFLAHNSPSIVASGRGRYCSKSCASQNSGRRHGRSFGPSRIGNAKLDPTYVTWQAMLGRCTNPNSPSWQHYGAKGITVCERWRDFTNFLADMGERPEGTSIDRIKCDGNYEPSNCRWATAREQAQNRPDAYWVEFRGERVAAAELERRFGLPRGCVSNRVRLGWEGERLVAPLRKVRRLAKV